MTTNQRAASSVVAKRRVTFDDVIILPRRSSPLAARVRLRPILMTSIAMIAGMVPVAMRLTVGSEGRAPMAVAVIGGIISSTFLTLVVVPAMYTLVDDFEAWLAPKVSRHLTPHETA